MSKSGLCLCFYLQREGALTLKVRFALFLSTSETGLELRFWVKQDPEQCYNLASPNCARLNHYWYAFSFCVFLTKKKHNSG